MERVQIKPPFDFDSLEACKGIKAIFYWLSQPYKFKFSSSRKWKVHVFEEMTNSSLLSEKKLPLVAINSKEEVCSNLRLLHASRNLAFLRHVRTSDSEKSRPRAPPATGHRLAATFYPSFLYSWSIKDDF
jgi:hypothetical protein